MPRTRMKPGGSLVIGTTGNCWILFLLIETKGKKRARAVPPGHNKNNMIDHCILKKLFAGKKVSDYASHNRAVQCNTLCFIIQSDPASNPLEVMPYVMRHPCGSTKSVMDPRVALRLPEDDPKKEGEARSGDGTMRKGEVGQQYYMKEKFIVSPNSSPVLFPKKAQQLLSLLFASTNRPERFERNP